jgi:hypothetical protein
MNRSGLLRRDFLAGMAAAATATLLPARTLVEQSRPIAGRLPPRPREKPLPWRSIADAFDAWIMNPENRILLTRNDGTLCFTSATEAKNDGGLTTFGPIALGKLLRGEDVSRLLPSLGAYFSESAGIFLDGAGAKSCEYWYLMNVNALAAGLIRCGLADSPAWQTRQRRSAERLKALARQVHYNFNDQGYDFAAGRAWTKKDIYRQPDAVAGYAYLMLFAHERFGGGDFFEEARTALLRYQAFSKNPWYEIPSGAMGCLAAARLRAHYKDRRADVHKALSFALDPEHGALHSGDWGDKQVDGLMAGWGNEPPGEAYSMESMVTLPYLLPVVRYCPQFATGIGKYVLNAVTNTRWFYPEYLPAAQQSKPGIAPAIPYEKLVREKDGHSPYAYGDYDGHRSVYGGAYALWLGELIRPTTDESILQLDLTKTDFLAAKAYPTWLFYNPWPAEREVRLDVGTAKSDVRDIAAHRFLEQGAAGSIVLRIPANGSRVVAVVPSGKTRRVEGGTLNVEGVPVDYAE